MNPYPHRSPFRCIGCGTWYPQHVGWCSSCFGTGTVVAVGSRTRAMVDGVPERTDAKALSRQTWQRIETASFENLSLCRGALVVVVGEPASGKSSWVVRALDGIKGPVAYVSCEEAPGPTVAARLLRCAVRRGDFHVVGRASVDQVVCVANETKARALAIDSANVADFNARDLRHLLAVLPHLEVLFSVAQVNRDGVMAGPREMEHESDVAVRCESLLWALTKSRYQDIAGVGGHVLREAPHAA